MAGASQAPDAWQKGGEVTDDRLLGGRVRYRQPRTGYRTGIEPVLLAASIPAQPGQRVMEAGTGAGAGLLCLSARCRDLSGAGVERDPALAALAQTNLVENGATGIAVVAADILCLPDTPPFGQPFHHAFANPPWHGECHTASPNAMRDAAKRGSPSLFHAWAAAMAKRLHPGGSLTLIVPAGGVPAALAAVEAAQCGGIVLLPLWPREGVAARIVLVRAYRAGRTPCRVLPGLVLHTGAGFTPEAIAVLWHGAELPL